jgi:hypothetical protein
VDGCGVIVSGTDKKIESSVMIMRRSKE